MVELSKLRHFCVLVRAGGYAKAAVELHMTQSSLTRSIQSLERHLGARLVRREQGRAGIALTDEGQIVLRRAREMLRGAEELKQEVASHLTTKDRSLSFGLGPMLAGALLHDFSSAFIVEHPDHSVFVLIDTPMAMTQKLLNNEIDFYIGQPPPMQQPSRRINQRWLGMAIPRFFVRPGHPLAGQDVVPPDELARFGLMTGTAWNRTFLPQLSDSLLRQQLTARVQIDNIELLADLALRTDSILLSVFADWAGQLVELPVKLDTVLPPAGMHFMTQEGTELSPLAAAAADWLLTKLGKLIGTDLET